MQQQNESEEIEACWTTKGFNTRFDQLIQSGEPYWRAYLLAEEEHVSLFGKVRFKSYESFRNSRRNMLFGNR